MSIPEKEDLLKGARSELSNFQITVKLLQALIDNFKGLSPEGSVLWGNVYVVDNDLGDDDTAQPNSLSLTYQTPQAAIDAAEAILLLGVQTLATILFLPGTFNLAAAPKQIVWPNVAGIHFVGIDPVNTVIMNDGSQPLIIGAPVVDGFTGSISNLRLVTAESGFALALNRTGAAGVLPTSFAFYNVGFTGLRRLIHFSSVTDTETYLADPAKVSIAVMLDVADVSFKDSDVLPGGIRVEHEGTGRISLVGTATGTLGVGITTASAATVTIDPACKFGATTIHLGGGAYSLRAEGSLGTVALELADEAGQVIDIGGSSLTSLDVTGDGAAGTFDVLALGCLFTGTPSVVAAHSNVVLDVRGAAGVLSISGTGGATVDRDTFGSHAFGIPVDGSAGIGNHTFAPPLPSTVDERDYEVVVESNVEVSTWITAKSATGYTLNYGASAAGADHVIYTMCLRRDSAAG